MNFDLFFEGHPETDEMRELVRTEHSQEEGMANSPLPAGSVLHWNNFFPNRNEYLLVIGSHSDGSDLAFTITTQSHWARENPHRALR